MKNKINQLAQHFYELFILIFTAYTVYSQAPLTVNGVSDKSTYNNSVTLRVPRADGYTYNVLLDDKPVPTDTDIVVNEMNYHELNVSRWNISTGEFTNRLIRFIVLHTDRGSPEKGIMKWQIFPPTPSTAQEIAGAQLEIMMPAQYPGDLPLPVIARVNNADDRARRVNGWLTLAGDTNNALQIIRGHGSAVYPPAGATGTKSFEARFGPLTTTRLVQFDGSTVWTPVSGTLSGSNYWAENSRVFINGNLTIPAGSTLTIGAGTIVKLAPLVNITNSGRIVINGTIEQPVVFTATNIVYPEQHTYPWGGFIMRGSSAVLIANSTIFAGGGGAQNFGSFSPGASHRSEQPVLLIHSGAQAYLTNCAIINTAGQIGNGYDCRFIVERCLFQRAITAGEYAGANSYILINNSALMEFPKDDGIVDATIADADYDCIYFTEGTHILMNSLFGFAKDDAVDSGSGGAGTMLLTNCWIESALHEAQAWSGGGRKTWTYDTVNINCGQGIECGWSTGNDSPDCFAERLLTTANGVGARIGDNYDWSYNGYLKLTNSIILYNWKDIFLKTWNGVGSGWNALSWQDRLQQATIISNIITRPDARFPSNKVWEPQTDAQLLAHWMTTPPDAPVGVAIALRTNRLAISNLIAGVPVRLSSFTTHRVEVSYGFNVPEGFAPGGTLLFEPGETVKFIYPAGIDLSTAGQIDVVLTRATGGEITGLSQVTFTGVINKPQVSLNVINNYYSPWLLKEGVFISLSNPSALSVGLNYQFSAPTGIVQTGVIVFEPMITRTQLFLTAASPFQFTNLQLTVFGATNATLTGITNITFTNTITAMTVSFVYTNNQSLGLFAQGVPLKLNTPASSPVEVQLSVEGNRTGSTNITLSFSAGDLVKTMFAPSISTNQNEFIRVQITGVTGVELAGRNELYFIRTITAPPQSNIVLIAKGANTIWRYRDVASPAPADWNTLGFDDSSWKSGGAQLGFGDGDETTRVANNQQTTTYFRRLFVVDDPDAYQSLYLWLLRDDGGVVYINGVDVYRSPSMPQPPAQITYYTFATNQSTSSAPPDNTIDTATIPATYLRPGTNVVAVEIHQFNASSSDISFDFQLEATPKPAKLPQPIYYGFKNGTLTLAWGDATFKLLESDKVTGPWRINNLPADGVITLQPTNAQHYFRLIGQ